MVAKRKRVSDSIFRFLEKSLKLPSLSKERRVGDEREREQLPNLKSSKKRFTAIRSSRNTTQVQKEKP
jgi:hypothetical protein